MGYGAIAQRAEARNKGAVNLANMYRLLIVGRFERGFAGLQDSIYSPDDFRKKNGRFLNDRLSPLVYKSLVDGLDEGVQVEVKTLDVRGAGATQSSYPINDQGTPEVFGTVKAGRLGKDDLSSYGDGLAIKTANSENYSFVPQADLAIGATGATLDNVEKLEVGYKIHINDNGTSYYAILTGVDKVTKDVTFAALGNGAAITASTCTITRCDWSLQVAAKNEKGTYVEQESYPNIPIVKSSTLGMELIINDSSSGSQQIVFEHNAGNGSAAADYKPVELSTWTPLTGGADGAVPAASDYKTAIDAVTVDPEVAILLAPELASAQHANNMINWTSGGRAVYFDQAPNGAGEDSLKAQTAKIRADVVFGMLPGDKWINVDDPTKPGAKIAIPNVGVAAAHWFNTYTRRGIQKVAAGYNKAKGSFTFDDANGLRHSDTSGKGGILIRDYSVNICAFHPGAGNCFNSARTYSTDGGYTFQNQLFQFIEIKRSILEYLKTIEQDEGGINAQEDHYNVIYSFMLNKYENGEFFQGQKDDGTLTTFKDVVILENSYPINKLTDLQNGIEKIFLQFISPPPIEEPKLLLASAPVTSI